MGILMDLYVLYKAPWQRNNYTELAIYKLVRREKLEWEFICNAGSQFAKEMGGYNAFQFVKFKPDKLKIHTNYCNWMVTSFTVILYSLTHHKYDEHLHSY